MSVLPKRVRQRETGRGRLLIFDEIKKKKKKK
jgi:hypothetical protein